MRLRQLVLRNFGLYRGEQVIDLAPRSRRGKARPIVLVGGQNGAGKTTVLDAVRLCLYGRLALGARVTEADYHAHLRERIYRGKEVVIPVSYASVAMEFDYANGGKQSTYLVRRAWETRGQNGVTETLRVDRDGEPLADVDSQFWPEFVRSLIPPGVSQLFFFDGEKVKRLAEEESEAETLAESIKALLGLDLVERLQADLDLYNARYLKKTATGALAKRLGEIETAETSCRSELDGLKQNEDNLRGRLADLAARIDRTEQTLAQRGEGLSAQRGELRSMKGELDARREQQQKALRDLCEGPLPFALCPRLSEELLTQLECELRRERWDSSCTEIGRALGTVTQRLVCGKLPRALGWGRDECAAVADEIGAVAKELAQMPDELATVRRLHGLSNRVREEAQLSLSQALKAIPAQVAEMTTALCATIEGLRKVQENLNRAPQGDEIAPIVKQLSTMQEEHAGLTLELTLKTEHRAKIEREVAALARERNRITDNQKEAQGTSARLALAISARHALGEYLERLTMAKVDELQVVALKCFQTLSRKTDLVRDLRIDPRSFAVVLLDGSGQLIPKASLSAGEKQIYAVSLLWALAKVSGRPLPMIVDTPLGRLDSVHRQHLLERYFPVASHQVVILSTDTEVDRASFEMLKPFTSHSVHLVNRSGWTEAMPGYFWREEAANVGASA